VCALPVRSRRRDGRTSRPGSFHDKTSLRAELWEYAFGPSFLELSFKVPKAARAAVLRDELAAEIRRRHLTPNPPGTPKTETVLRLVFGAKQ
jgi:hypothetical protein